MIGLSEINASDGESLRVMQARLQNSLYSSSVKGIIGGFSQSDYVLSPSLLNQIYDHKALNSNILRSYEARVEESIVPPEESIDSPEESISPADESIDPTESAEEPS